MLAKNRKIEGQFILSTDGAVLYKYMTTKYGYTSVTIPESVRVIAEGAFRCWENVQRGPSFITLNDSIERIERRAFYGCPMDLQFNNLRSDIMLVTGWDDIGTGWKYTSTDKIEEQEYYLNREYSERAFDWVYDRESLFHTKGKIQYKRALGYNKAESSITISKNSEIPIQYFLRQLPIWIYVVDETTGEVIQKIWSGYGTESHTCPGEIVEMLCYLALDSPTFDYTWYEEIYNSIKETSSKNIIAKLRLENPVNLSNEARKEYRKQILKDAPKVLRKAIEEGNIELVREYRTLNAITKATKKILWESMQEVMDLEIVQLLQEDN